MYDNLELLEAVDDGETRPMDIDDEPVLSAFELEPDELRLNPEVDIETELSHQEPSTSAESTEKIRSSPISAGLFAMRTQKGSHSDTDEIAEASEESEDSPEINRKKLRVALDGRQGDLVDEDSLNLNELSL
jgi:hypothetical protein